MKRIQVLISHSGLASRREAEQLISDGRVTVNGHIVTQPGSKADPLRDQISVDGNPIPACPRPRVIMFHKPPGVICSHNQAQGRTIHELLSDIPEKLICIGRLDKNSEGLLLLTTDGAIANRLMHPRYDHAKVYEVTLAGRLSDRTLSSLRKPIEIEGIRTRPAIVSRAKQASRKDITVVYFTLSEGRNRQIRRLCEAAGVPILRLRRLAFGALDLGDLPAGKWRSLSSDEWKALGIAP